VEIKFRPAKQLTERERKWLKASTRITRNQEKETGIFNIRMTLGWIKATTRNYGKEIRLLGTF